MQKIFTAILLLTMISTSCKTTRPMQSGWYTVEYQTGPFVKLKELPGRYMLPGADTLTPGKKIFINVLKKSPL